MRSTHMMYDVIIHTRTLFMCMWIYTVTKNVLLYPHLYPHLYLYVHTNYIDIVVLAASLHHQQLT